MTAATTPSRAEFLRLADTARVIPVVRTVLADGLTPLAIHRRLAGSRPGTCSEARACSCTEAGSETCTCPGTAAL